MAIKKTTEYVWNDKTSRSNKNSLKICFQDYRCEKFTRWKIMEMVFVNCKMVVAVNKIACL